MTRKEYKAGAEARASTPRAVGDLVVVYGHQVMFVSREPPSRYWSFEPVINLERPDGVIRAAHSEEMTRLTDAVVELWS